MRELDDMPLYDIQFMYYQFWIDRQEEEKMTDEERGAKALGNAIEDSM